MPVLGVCKLFWRAAHAKSMKEKFSGEAQGRIR